MPIVQQKVQLMSTMAQGGHPQEALSVTEFTTYRPYIQVELVDLGTPFWQRRGEPLSSMASVMLGVMWGW